MVQGATVTGSDGLSGAVASSFTVSAFVQDIAGNSASGTGACTVPRDQGKKEIEKKEGTTESRWGRFQGNAGAVPV